MKDILLHFAIAFAISFVGTIPPGGINLYLIQLSVNKGVKAAFYFIVGVIIVEIIFCYLALESIGVLMQEEVYSIIRWIAIPVFIIMGIISIRTKPDTSEVKVDENGKSFMKGMFLSVINPLQFPFWIGYGAYLISVGLISRQSVMLFSFAIGAGAGTMVILLIMAIYSHKIVNRFKWSASKVNLILGGTFFLLAAFEIGKIVVEYITAL